MCLCFDWVIRQLGPLGLYPHFWPGRSMDLRARNLLSLSFLRTPGSLRAMRGSSQEGVWEVREREDSHGQQRSTAQGLKSQGVWGEARLVVLFVKGGSGKGSRWPGRSWLCVSLRLGLLFLIHPALHSTDPQHT